MSLQDIFNKLEFYSMNIKALKYRIDVNNHYIQKHIYGVHKTPDSVSLSQYQNNVKLHKRLDLLFNQVNLCVMEQIKIRKPIQEILTYIDKAMAVIDLASERSNQSYHGNKKFIADRLGNTVYKRNRNMQAIRSNL